MSNTEIKGILGAKLGMTQVFDENNRVVPVTVVKAGPCVVTGIRTEDKDGYNAVQIASIRGRSPSPSRGSSRRRG